MRYRLNHLDEPVFIAGPKPLRSEFDIHQRLESCVVYSTNSMDILDDTFSHFKMSLFFPKRYFRNKELQGIMLCEKSGSAAQG